MNQLGLGQLDGATKNIMVYKAASRFVKAFVEAPDCVPGPARHEQGVGFRDRLEPAVNGRFVRRPNLEEAVAVPWPLNFRQQGIFAFLIVAVTNRPPLKVEAQIPANRSDNRAFEKRCRMPSEMEQPRRDNPRSIDHYPYDVVLRFCEASIHRLRRRRRSRIKPNEPKITGKLPQDLSVEWRTRPVIDHDDLVVVGADVALVLRGERKQRPRGLPVHVEDDYNQ